MGLQSQSVVKLATHTQAHWRSI